MNKILLETIVKHIYESLIIIHSNNINKDNHLSLLDKNFLLDKKIKFEYGEEIISKKVWGCQFLTESQGIKILCADCNETDNYEYAVIISLKDNIIYGLYSCFNKDKLVDQEAMIAVSNDGKSWMECNTGLQATFLAGMEHIKDIGISMNKCVNYSKEFEYLISFIDYHDLVYGENDEG